MIAVRLLQRTVLATLLVLFLPVGCATTGPLVTGDVEEGIASYMHSNLHGNLTANGERYDENEMTAAHRTLPFNTVVRVTNTRNGNEVTVRINDRGPFVRGRIIDLSRAAAEALDFIEEGLVEVRVEVIKQPE